MTTATAAAGSLPAFALKGEEKGRYRLYAMAACTFAHRVRLVRLLREGAEDAILVTMATDQKAAEGFCFRESEPEFGAQTLMDVYKAVDPSHEGKASVPLIVDRRNKSIVKSESLDLALGLAKDTPLLPDGAMELAQELADKVTMAPYKFLMIPESDSDAKQAAKEALWEELQKYNQLLASQPYLMGNRITVPDCILFSTLVRYENVYARSFNLKGKSLKQDFPNLAAFTKRIWERPSKSGACTIGEDVDMQELIRLYWQSEKLSPLVGNDPKAPVPGPVPVFGESQFISSVEV